MRHVEWGQIIRGSNFGVNVVVNHFDPNHLVNLVVTYFEVVRRG